MFDLLIYDRRQTAKLLRLADLRLPGTPIESALMPTSELLVLMREDDSCSLYLCGGSELFPTMRVKEQESMFNAPLLIPFTARKLMGGSQGVNILHVTRVQFKEALRRAKAQEGREIADVAVQIGQH